MHATSHLGIVVAPFCQSSTENNINVFLQISYCKNTNTERFTILGLKADLAKTGNQNTEVLDNYNFFSYFV